MWTTTTKATTTILYNYYYYYYCYYHYYQSKYFDHYYYYYLCCFHFFHLLLMRTMKKKEELPKSTTNECSAQRTKRTGKELRLTSQEFRETSPTLPVQFFERRGFRVFRAEFHSFGEDHVRCCSTISCCYYYCYSYSCEIGGRDSKHQILTKYSTFFRHSAPLLPPTRTRTTTPIPVLLPIPHCRERFASTIGAKDLTLPTSSFFAAASLTRSLARLQLERAPAAPTPSPRLVQGERVDKGDRLQALELRKFSANRQLKRTAANRLRESLVARILQFEKTGNLKKQQKQKTTMTKTTKREEEATNLKWRSRHSRPRFGGFRFAVRP